VVFNYVGAHLVCFTVIAEQRGGLHGVNVALWGGRIADSAPRDGLRGWQEAVGLGLFASHTFTWYLTGTSPFLLGLKIIS